MKIDFKNKKVIIGGAVALVILVAGISVAAVLMLSGDKTADSNDTPISDTIVEEPNTETNEPSSEQDENTDTNNGESNGESVDTPIDEIEVPTLEDVKLFDEEEWRGDDVDKAKAYNYYYEIKTNGTLQSPEKYLTFIKETVANDTDNIKSFPKKDEDILTEIYKDMATKNVVMRLYFNNEKIANKFIIFGASQDCPDVKIITTDDGYVKELYDASVAFRLLKREYSDGVLVKETEIVRVADGVVTNTRTEFSTDGTTCKQMLELKLTKQTEFENSVEQFMALLSEDEQEFFKDYVKHVGVVNIELNEDENLEIEVEEETSENTEETSEEVESTEENKTE